MPGQRGVNRDAGGFFVADLADHDDVRVLPQEGAEAGGEGDPGSWIDLDLRDPRELILNGVLDRGDVDLGLVQPVKHRIQARRLARPGRARDQDDPVWSGDDPLESREIVGRHAQPVDPDEGGAFVEDPHDDLLAPRGWNRGHAQVDIVVVDLELDTPVLGNPALGNVHRRHDLETRDQRRLDARGWRHRAVESSVDTVADPHEGLHRLDVDVAGRL